MDRERVCRLAQSGDREAFRELLRLRTRDPEDEGLVAAQVQGWKALLKERKRLLSLMHEGRPDKKVRIAHYLEELGLEPANVWHAKQIALLEETGARDWTVYGIPRQTGRTTLLLLTALCAVEDGLREVRFHASTRGRGEKLVDQFREFAERLQVPLLGVVVTYLYDKAYTARPLRHTPSPSLYVDNWIEDYERIRRVDYDK